MQLFISKRQMIVKNNKDIGHVNRHSMGSCRLLVKVLHPTRHKIGHFGPPGICSVTRCLHGAIVAAIGRGDQMSVFCLDRLL